MRSLALTSCLSMLLAVSGCASFRLTSGQIAHFEATIETREKVEASDKVSDDTESSYPGISDLHQVGYETSARRQFMPEAEFVTAEVPLSTSFPDPLVSLEWLIDTAWTQNPRLQRLDHEYRAALSKTQWVNQLPDPKMGANIFGSPIETAAGSQRAVLSLSQTIPWLDRLNAEQQKACFEAMAIQSEYLAERLRVTAEIRVAWYQLYVIDKQIEITQTNQELLESLLNVANARIATGAASQGDVLLGTLELSQLEQRILSYRKQRRATEIEINRLAGQPTDISLGGPSEIPMVLPELDSDQIFETAKKNQPALEAIRLRMQASQWGIQIARLTRRPEMTLSASYFPTDDNRMPSSQVHVGQDPWAVGIQVTLPWSREKYDAIANEAAYRHQTVHSTLADLEDQYEALIQSLLTEARRAADTTELYQSSILPQARQTLESDQKSYANGTVEFDRVMQDYRNLLTLELGYHQALGDLAQALARLQRTAGQDFPIESPPAISTSP